MGITRKPSDEYKSNPHHSVVTSLKNLSGFVSSKYPDIANDLCGRIAGIIAVASNTDIEAAAAESGVIAKLQEELDEIKLEVKYLLFDLKATRRERDEYKRKLDEQIDEINDLEGQVARLNFTIEELEKYQDDYDEDDPYGNLSGYEDDDFDE